MIHCGSGTRIVPSLRRGLALAATVLLFGSQAPGEEAPDLARVREAYRGRADHPGEILVEYEYHGKPLADPKLIETFDYFNIETRIDAKSAFKGQKLFYSQKYRQYYDQKDAVGGPMSPIRWKVETFDGSVTRIYEETGPPETKGNAMLEVFSGNEVDNGALDVFLSYHGFPRVAPLSFYLDDRTKPASTRLHDLLDDAGCRAEPRLEPDSDGTPCVVLSANGQRAWFDPRLGFALRQREWTGPGPRGLITRIRFREHAEIRPGVWLARSIERECFADPEAYPALANTPYRTESIKVQTLTPGPVPDSLFEFQPPPGTLVTDASKIPIQPGEGYHRVVTYSVPAAPLSVDDASERALRQAKDALDNPSPSGRAGRWFLVINGLAIAGIVAFLVVRARRSTGS